jgi:hypothetical protein
MQLDSAPTTPLRSRLNAAACMLFAAGMPAVAGADTPARWQVDASALLYGEQARATVVEPVARITRLFANGHSLSAQLGLDAITGASPTGGLPSGRIQTTTTASGNVRTVAADQVPVATFSDFRGSLDLEWRAPVGGRVTTTTTAHVSREKDYQSLGGTAGLAIQLMHRLTTLSAGVGFNQDGVFPVGGTPAGLTDGSVIVGTGSNPKQVSNVVFGLSRVLTRRWMMGLDVGRTLEDGYLTEPYKVVSLIDPEEGTTTGELTELRPTLRRRSSVLASSVYHLQTDVLYTSYRYYWDDWQVQSHALDLKLRHELPNDTYLQPHVRYYRQSAADFHTFGLIRGAPLPEFASSDYRLGQLSTATLGATYGFHLADYRGEWSIRAEYMRQWGNSHPPEAVGVEENMDLVPPLNIGSVLVGYTIQF